jgi:hypothetical protein
MVFQVLIPLTWMGLGMMLAIGSADGVLRNLLVLGVLYAIQSWVSR